jgi:hypothetical protein
VYCICHASGDVGLVAVWGQSGYSEAFKGVRNDTKEEAFRRRWRRSALESGTTRRAPGRWLTAEGQTAAAVAQETGALTWHKSWLTRTPRVWRYITHTPHHSWVAPTGQAAGPSSDHGSEALSIED